MTEIKCPHCGKFFQIDESGYAAIVKQVRDAEFDRIIHERLEQASRERETAVAVAVLEAERKNAEALSRRDQALTELQMRLDAADTAQKLAVAETVSREREKQAELERGMLTLQAELKSREDAAKLREQNLRASFDEQLRAKDELVAYYRDFKARQSTKMVGESLEVHCMTEFEKLRSTGFQRAYFEKDNDARSGSKGDFIFRDYDEDGLEYISIMFEMKNEMEETATKHKNADFLRELDRDRREKQCEYAVLVTMLEP
ncbi:MAG: DUF2130 domain-containing protein, partial [Oscillospiraceae bacterium]|nr:DUF2130 domain-containing protein [Oscillospiraceae bacterium]